MSEAPHPYPIRCASCACLYYQESRADYLCDVCLSSLRDYVRSLDGIGGNATMAWWDRQRALRGSQLTGR